MLNQAGHTVTNSNPTPFAIGGIPGDGNEMVETRFGSVAITRDNPLLFERGLLGIPNSREFCLTDFPGDTLQQFKLLQSLEEDSMSFITLPLAPDNKLIDRADLEKACADVGVGLNEVAILLIVSVHRSPSAVQLSVNVRAPLLVNAQTRRSVQYVFQHSRYKVQHLLEMA